MAAWIQLLARESGPVRVHLSADHFVVLPVELCAPTGPVYVTSEDLGLGADLEAALPAWQRWFDENTDVATDPIERGTEIGWHAWREAGARLAHRLAEELGSDFDVHLT